MASGDDISPQTILRAQSGDAAAFHSVLEACRQRLKRLAYKLTYSRSEIEPLVNAGRMGIHEAVRKYETGRGAAFWTFAYLIVLRHMLDALTKQLNLSDDARRAYKRVRDSYSRREKEGEHAPDAAEIAEECGVSLTLVERLIRVVLQPEASLDEIAEQDWGRQSTKQRDAQAHMQTPEELVIAAGDRAELRAAIGELCVARLGEVEGARFLVLTILREGRPGYDYGWDEIAAQLRGEGEPSSPEWADMLENEFGGWNYLPPTWAAVRTLFLSLNAQPTAGYLRQRFSHARRCLIQGAPQGAPANAILEQFYG